MLKYGIIERKFFNYKRFLKAQIWNTIELFPEALIFVHHTVLNYVSKVKIQNFKTLDRVTSNVM